MPKITPVILSGGAGSRLWPISHGARPKQLIPLLGSERSLLQETALRVADTSRFNAPVVVTSMRHGQDVEAQLLAAGVQAAKLVVEPAGRNTAAAIALAALEADPAELLLVMPSDHAIGDVACFLDHVEAAASLADQDLLVTFGIKPERPETGYGYIKLGRPLGTGRFRADRFVEKPDALTATQYVADGTFLWNAGIFLFRAGALLVALEVHAPNVIAAVRSALAGAERIANRIQPEPVVFGGAPALSIDNAVMERADNVAVVPVDVGWSDVGSWDALYELGPKDRDGNVLAGDTMSLDSNNCLLRTEGPALVAVEVHDLVVVATERAVLVIPRGSTQRVKEVLERIPTSP